MFLWRTGKHYLSIIIKYTPYLFSGVVIVALFSLYLLKSYVACSMNFHAVYLNVSTEFHNWLLARLRIYNAVCKKTCLWVTIPLLLKSAISKLYPSPEAIQPGLCRTWSEIPKTGFLTTRLTCLWVPDQVRLCFRGLARGLKFCIKKYEPRCEKTGLRGLRPGPTQTGLCSHRRRLEA